ncbi:Nicolin-1, partial [Lamellibrachia satsuma]
MPAKRIDYSVKPAVVINFGDGQKEFHSGCSVVDFVFPKALYVEVAEIHFRNYYTSWLTVKACIRDSSHHRLSAEGRWKTCVRKMQLMPPGHSDKNCEHYFTISTKQMAFPLRDIITLWFILRQPSPLWKEFRIDDIRLYKFPLETQDEPSLHSLSWLFDSTRASEDKEQPHETDTKKPEGVSSISDLSRSLQQLWAVSQKVALNQPAHGPGRYD